MIDTYCCSTVTAHIVVTGERTGGRTGERTGGLVGGGSERERENERLSDLVRCSAQLLACCHSNAQLLLAVCTLCYSPPEAAPIDARPELLLLLPLLVVVHVAVYSSCVIIVQID